METVNFIIVPFQLIDYLLAVPRHLQSELELAFHLLQNVLQGRVNALEDLANIFVRAEHGTETHRNDGLCLHHGLDDVLVSQRVLASRIEDEHGCLAHDRSNVAMMHGVDQFAGTADPGLAKSCGIAGLNHAINITTFLLWSANRRWSQGAGISRQRVDLTLRLSGDGPHPLRRCRHCSRRLRYELRFPAVVSSAVA